MSKSLHCSWQAIIFDLDDTLYHERDYVLSGFRAVAAWVAQRLGWEAAASYAQLAQLYASGVRGDTFNRWLAAHQISDPDMLTELVRVYREHEPELKPYPEVPSVLQQLRQRYKLGLVSDGYLAVQQRKMAALGLAACFDALIFSDQFGREAWKPSPLPFQQVLAALATPAAAAVYIGDNPRKDFLGARKAGMVSIRIVRKGGEYTHLIPTSPQHEPDATIHNLRELVTLCDQQGR